MLKSERVHFPNQSACDSTTTYYHPQSALSILGAGPHAGSSERTHSVAFLCDGYFLDSGETNTAKGASEHFILM